jgi:competence protein ComEC
MADRWTRGRRVRAPVALRWPAMTYNPGAPDPQWQALVRRFALTGTIKSGALVEVERAAAWDEWAAGVRRHVRGAIARAIAPRDAQAAAIVVAILIGDRAGLDPDTVRRLQDAGTYHVIAISGGNVALVVAIVVVILRGLTRSFRVASAVALATVLAYGWIVGGEPSVDRAVAAAAVYLLSNLAGLIVESVDVLLFALLALTLADPIMAVTPGVWLSFGATFAIVMGAERIASALGGRVRGGSRWARTWQSVLGLVAATMAAEVALAPIAASVFTRVSLAGLALNLIAIPAMAIVEIGGWAIVLTGAVPGVPSILAPLVTWATRALLDSARWVEIAPWLVWRVAPSSIAWTIVFYAAVAAALVVRRPRWRLAAGGVAALTLLVIVTSPALERAGPPRGWLRVTTIDVGQGDAILVQLPTRQSLLIDAGPATDTFDTGDRVVTPALWALGVRRLDWLAFTHADLDHIGGARLVAETFRPREIWEGVPVPTDPKRAALREAAARAGRAWRQVRAGDVLEAGGVTIDVLNPPVPDWERRRVRNDDSIVLRLRYGDVEWLLTGDISQAVEGQWPAGDDAGAPLRVLKVAHHGSRTSTGEPFVSRYAPVAAVISVGRQNVFGHPSPDVVQRLARVGAAVFRTDRDGAVIVETDGREIRVRTWLGRRWQARLASPRP